MSMPMAPRRRWATSWKLTPSAISSAMHKIAVSSTKSMTGHLLGGAGGLEAGITVLALRDQILPPTINLENQDPDTAGMDFVPNHARKASARIRHVELVRLRRDKRRAAV